MSTDTKILTDKQILDPIKPLGIKGFRETALAAGRAIEQAVLQSPEVLEMKDALSLVIDLSSQEYIDQNGNRIAVVGNGGERFWFITDDVMGAVRAAMERQP